MKCWICGADATSGEHLTKASDLRALFGNRSSHSPLFLHTVRKQNFRVQSIDSKFFKSKSLICAKCNNERSQPYDLAWEKLSDYLRNRRPPICSNSRIRLSPVFPGKVHESMLFVHLYFVKLFGCLISEHSIPIDISEFSKAILSNLAHPNVHLAFEAITDRRFHSRAGRTDIHTVISNGEVSFAVWLYDIGSVSVHVIFAKPCGDTKGLEYSWHPSTIGKCIRTMK